MKKQQIDHIKKVIPDNLSASIREGNQTLLYNAQQSIIHRTKDVSSAFESSLNLTKAALTLIIQDEINEDDAAAINEILMMLQDTIRAGYAQYLLE
jgi:hypothetical protein